jgi:hypothetical protein
MRRTVSRSLKSTLRHLPCFPDAALVMPTQPTRRASVHSNVVVQITNSLLQLIFAIFRSESWGCAMSSSRRSSPPRCSCGAGRAGRGRDVAQVSNKLCIFTNLLLKVCFHFLQRVLLVPSGRYFDVDSFVEAFAARSSAAAGSAGAHAAAAHVRSLPRWPQYHYREPAYLREAAGVGRDWGA